jgi:hypothetical protein
VKGVLTVKKLQNCIKLSSRVTVYVPATHDVNTETDNAEQVTRVASALSEWLGGATSSAAVGYWLSNTAGLVHENTVVVFAFASEKDLKAHVDDVVSLCESIRDEMSQEAVALEVNGEMYFV